MVSIKFIEIFTDGTVSIYYKGLKSSRQIEFREKDFKNLLLFKKPKKYSSFRNVSKNAYKSKYKF